MRAARSRPSLCLRVATGPSAHRYSGACWRSSTTKRRPASLRLARLPPWWATDLHQHKPPTTRLSKRDLAAQIVHRACWKHRDEIAEPRDVLTLPELADMPGEVVACAVADCIADGVVQGATGVGRMAVEEPQP